MFMCHRNVIILFLSARHDGKLSRLRCDKLNYKVLSKLVFRLMERYGLGTGVYEVKTRYGFSPLIIFRNKLLSHYMLHQWNPLYPLTLLLILYHWNITYLYNSRYPLQVTWNYRITPYTYGSMELHPIHSFTLSWPSIAVMCGICNMQFGSSPQVLW